MFLNIFFKRNYPFHCRLEYNNKLLKKIFGGKLKTLTGGWRKFQLTLENEICGVCEAFGRNEIIQKFLSQNLYALCCQRI